MIFSGIEEMFKKGNEQIITGNLQIYSLIKTGMTETDVKPIN